MTLTSITAYNEMDEFGRLENTGGPDVGGQPFLLVTRNQELEQWSQEIRVSTDYAGPFNFVAGLFYFKMDYALAPQTVDLLGANIARSFAEQSLEAYAAYGEMNYDLTEKTSLTLGGRFNYETKEISVAQRVGALLSCPDLNSPTKSCRDPKVDYDNFSPRIGIDHNFTDEMMGYFMWSRGFRSGGWNPRAVSPTALGPYDPETIDNFELGIRSEWFDNRLRVNATAFHMKYDDKQEAVHRESPLTLAVETVIENAASAQINGIELELQSSITANLSLNAAIGYLDAEYDEFLNDEGVDIKDQRRLNFAPEWSISVGGDYYHALDSIPGGITVSANYKWVDDYSTDPTRDPLGLDREMIDNYGEVDFSISYERVMAENKRIKISVFADDAFHSDGRISRVSNGGSFVFADQQPGRTWGVEFMYEM